MGWDQGEGKAKEAEGELRKPGWGGWRHSRSSPTPRGLGSLMCLVHQVQHLLLLPLRQRMFPVCRLVLCSFNTDSQTVLCFISLVFFKFAVLVFFPLYSCFHTFVGIAVLEKLDSLSSNEEMLQGCNPVPPLGRQAELRRGAARCRGCTPLIAL